MADSNGHLFHANFKVTLDGGTPAVGNTIAVTFLTRNGVTLSSVPAGISVTTTGTATINPSRTAIVMDW
jgi:hypothetical protein